MLTLDKYDGREGRGTFRPMTRAEAEALQPRQRVWFYTRSGDARMVTVNGKVQLWKRNPERITIPIKYGLYEFGYVTEQAFCDVAPGNCNLLVEVQ